MTFSVVASCFVSITFGPGCHIEFFIVNSLLSRKCQGCEAWRLDVRITSLASHWRPPHSCMQRQCPPSWQQSKQRNGHKKASRPFRYTRDYIFVESMPFHQLQRPTHQTFAAHSFKLSGEKVHTLSYFVDL